MGGNGFIRQTVVSTGSESTPADGCLFIDDAAFGEEGVRSADGGGVDSVISVTVCNFELPEAGLSPETVVALDRRTFCARLGCMACIVPEKDADLGE